jgi:hypothetical protein
MTKIKFLLIGISIFIFANAFSQSRNLKAEYTKLIVGTWKVDSLEIGSFNLSPEYQEIVKQKLPEIIANTEVVFKANKDYSKKGFEGSTSGKWEISKDGDYVLVKLDGSGTVSRTKIISLTSTKMVMAPDDENSANSRAFLYKFSE